MADQLPSLPTLPTIAPLTDTGSGNFATQALNAGALSSSGIFSGISNSVQSIFSPSNIENLIFVLLGLLLIAAGIFSFKTTQTVITTAGKYGAKAAEVAAA